MSSRGKENGWHANSQNKTVAACVRAEGSGLKSERYSIKFNQSHPRLTAVEKPSDTQENAPIQGRSRRGLVLLTVAILALATVSYVIYTRNVGRLNQEI